MKVTFTIHFSLCVAIVVATLAWALPSLVQTTPCIPSLQIASNDYEAESMLRALTLIQNSYPQDYFNSTISHHHFIKTASLHLQEELDNFVWTKNALAQIRHMFPPNTQVIPDVYHEIYLMRPEIDLLDKDKVHYDGILKLNGHCTIRALTYLSGDPATLVTLNSLNNFTTTRHSTIVLDFDRELHYVSMDHKNAHYKKQPRVLVKAALHVILPGTPPWITRLRICAHRIIFFAIKSLRNAFESSSLGTRHALMAVDNLMRCLNKIHMMLPLLIISPLLAAVLLAPILFPWQFLLYPLWILIVCLWNMGDSVLLGFAIVGLALWNSVSTPRTAGGTLLTFASHGAWIGICCYMGQNSDMAHKILLAPIPTPVELNELQAT